MGLDDPAVATGISDLLDPKAAAGGGLEFPPLYAEPAQAAKTPEDEDDEREYNEYHDFKWNTAGQEAVSKRCYMHIQHVQSCVLLLRLISFPMHHHSLISDCLCVLNVVIHPGERVSWRTRDRRSR